MEKQNYCTPLFKRWVKFLKQKNLYGRYILCMHRANRWKDRIFVHSQRNFWSDYTTFSTYNVSIKDIYLSKNDYFKDRYDINTLQELRNHMFNVGGYVSYEESVFWTEIYKEFRKVEERVNPTLPIPKSFKNRKNRRGKVKEIREDNLPWYSNYYQDRKVLWRR